MDSILKYLVKCLVQNNAGKIMHRYFYNIETCLKLFSLLEISTLVYMNMYLKNAL